MIRALAFTPELGVHPVSTAVGIAALLGDAELVLWLDVEQATADELGWIQREFGFHELAMEDVERPLQRPKINYYDDHRFVVIYAIARDDATLTPTEIDLFVGERYVVSLHRGPLPDFAEVEQRWLQAANRVDRSVVALFYALLDATVDGYFPAVDLIADRVEAIEEAMMVRGEGDALASMFSLKKQLIAMRRVLAPERDLLNGFLHREWPRLTPATLAYFQDVYDHVVRSIDSLDNYQDLLSNVHDVYVSMASNRLNAVVKRLTAIATILAVPTVVFSLYGMNFTYMPELRWEYGYPLAVLGTVAVSAIVAVILRRREWL
jgi:magnesium transporter